jgi:hypothetical protein
MSRFDFDVVTDPTPRPSRPPQHEPEPPREGADADRREAAARVEGALGEIGAVREP